MRFRKTCTEPNNFRLKEKEENKKYESASRILLGYCVRFPVDVRGGAIGTFERKAPKRTET